MKIVFFGTPDYVVPIAEKLHKAFRSKIGEGGVVAVVTQKPAPVGRKKILEYSPIDNWAHKKNIPILFNPGEVMTGDLEADVGILASYGALIPIEVIKHFSKGILVVHPSLLPQFRWASPVPGAILTGTNPTGVSIIKMDDKWDHGPIVTSFKEEVKEDDTYGSLRDRLFERSADVLIHALPAYMTGKINLKPQNDKEATFARIIKKEDAFIPPAYLKAALKGQILQDAWKIDFIKLSDGNPYSLQPTPYNLNRFIHAMDPWPIAWTEVKLGSDQVNLVKRLKILKAHLNPTTYSLQPDLVQLEGKDPVSWKQFTEGYPDYSF